MHDYYPKRQQEHFFCNDPRMNKIWVDDWCCGSSSTRRWHCCYFLNNIVRRFVWLLLVLWCCCSVREKKNSRSPIDEKKNFKIIAFSFALLLHVFF